MKTRKCLQSAALLQREGEGERERVRKMNERVNSGGSARERKERREYIVGNYRYKGLFVGTV